MNLTIFSIYFVVSRGKYASHSYCMWNQETYFFVVYTIVFTIKYIILFKEMQLRQ